MKLTERWNRTTLEKARARVITQAAACPSGFGEYAVDTAMHTYSTVGLPQLIGWLYALHALECGTHSGGLLLARSWKALLYVPGAS